MSMNVPGISASATPPVVSGASTRAPPQQKMTNLFNQIDTSGGGSITQAQFAQAFQTMNPPAAFQAAGATAVWNQLDPTGSGQVTKQAFVDGMKSLMVDLRQNGPSVSAEASQTAASATQALAALGTPSVDVLA